MKIKGYLKIFSKYILSRQCVLTFIGILAFCYTWLVGKTGKFEKNGLKEFEEMLEQNDGGIFVTWHGRALMLPFFWRNTRLMKALVSPHKDGRIIATLLRRFHILSIDGSTDKHACSSALEIIRELNAGTVVALIPDGPRGPSMKLNKSVIYFAQKTGKPIMGFTYSSKNARIAQKSWDQMLIPRLFAKGKTAATKPLFVPADATEEEMETLRQNFENELNTLTLQLDKEFGLPEILPGNTRRKRG